MLNFGRLFEASFWFSLRPSPLGEKTVLIVGGCFVAILVVALVLNFLAKTKKQNPPLAKIFKKFYKMLSTMAFMGLALLFLSYEQIYLLGAHFWFLVWFAGFLIWAVFIVYHIVKRMPEEKKELEQKKRFEKYLSY
jgi:phosphatidylglycerophosphate synthase